MIAEIATEYRDAGISVIPVQLGNKRPAVPAWRHMQERMPTNAELREWFSRPVGIAIICGQVSGGIEVLDFDDWTCFHPWTEKLDPSLVSILPVVETGGGGFHVIYRCREIAGNTKLAMQTEEDGGVRIETRGEGGYIVAVGSPIEVHSSGNPYVQVFGPVLPAVPTITPDERLSLWKAARAFNLGKQPHAKVQAELKRIRHTAKVDRPAGKITPWEDFDARGDWSFLSAFGELHGDQWLRHRSDGKKPHTSAVIRTSSTTGQEVLTVFSTSVPSGIAPKDQQAGTSYGKFHVYKTLVHGGDGKAAARELAAKGYGKQAEPDITFTLGEGVIG